MLITNHSWLTNRNDIGDVILCASWFAYTIKIQVVWQTRVLSLSLQQREQNTICLNFE